MKWLQAIQSKRPQHKYAINAKLLGDEAEWAWSNLGYWHSSADTYPQACRALAEHLAQAINLNSNDRLLDLGCGKGASLLLWQNQFDVKHIEAVELQKECVEQLNSQLQQNSLNQIHKIHQSSFLNLNQQMFEFKFDAVLCIDAIYHSALNSFLYSVTPLLNSKARIGFHTLILSEQFQHLNSFEKLKLKALLKCADVNLTDLLDRKGVEDLLRTDDFECIQIENLTKAVLYGFSDYIQTRNLNQYRSAETRAVDLFKIEMTAKLCKKLYLDGLIEYAQVTAQRKN